MSRENDGRNGATSKRNLCEGCERVTPPTQFTVVKTVDGLRTLCSYCEVKV